MVCRDIATLSQMTECSFKAEQYKQHWRQLQL